MATLQPRPEIRLDEFFSDMAKRAPRKPAVCFVLEAKIEAMPQQVGSGNWFRWIRVYMSGFFVQEGLGRSGPGSNGRIGRRHRAEAQTLLKRLEIPSNPVENGTVAQQEDA